MNYMNMLDCSIADGPGFRVVLFVTGCSHHCKGCHNKKCWDAKHGKLFDEKAKEKLFTLLSRNYIDGITLSGGDPLYIGNRDDITKLCKEIREKFPNKTIWLYTGYKFETIKDWDIIKYVNVVVDGKFEIDKRDVTLPFRGSSNQRIINIKDVN